MRQSICIPTDSPRMVLYLKVKDASWPAHLSSVAPLSRCEMTQRVVVGKDNTFMPQQILSEFLRHSPFECQELQFQGAVGPHVAVCGDQSSAGISLHSCWLKSTSRINGKEKSAFALTSAFISLVLSDLKLKLHSSGQFLAKF